MKNNIFKNMYQSTKEFFTNTKTKKIIPSLAALYLITNPVNIKADSKISIIDVSGFNGFNFGTNAGATIINNKNSQKVKNSVKTKKDSLNSNFEFKFLDGSDFNGFNFGSNAGARIINEEIVNDSINNKLNQKLTSRKPILTQTILPRFYNSISKKDKTSLDSLMVDLTKLKTEFNVHKADNDSTYKLQKELNKEIVNKINELKNKYEGILSKYASFKQQLNIYGDKINANQDSIATNKNNHVNLAKTVNDTLRKAIAKNTTKNEEQDTAVAKIKKMFTEGKYNLFIGPRIVSYDSNKDDNLELADGYIIGLSSGGDKTRIKTYFISPADDNKKIKEINKQVEMPIQIPNVERVEDNYQKITNKKIKGTFGLALETILKDNIYLGFGIESVPTLKETSTSTGTRNYINDQGQIVDSQPLLPSKTDKQKSFNIDTPLCLTFKGKHYSVDLKYGLISNQGSANVSVPINLDYLRGRN